ncbi:MAG: hypothetical protein LH480_02240 [Rubrivivax sp.]|nr:hypothetical protein [Rubrivivax sp.]
MSQLIVDYTLDSTTPANPDATVAATVTGCTVMAGPGTTTLGSYARSLDFGAGASLTAQLPVAALNGVKFAVRTVFKVDVKPVARQTLVCSAALPLRLAIEPGGGSSDFHLVAGLTLTTPNAGQVSTQWLMDLKLGTWYAADLVYDTDTLGLYVNGVIRSVRAYPAGTLAAGSGDLLRAGVAINGIDEHFVGSMAALQLHADIPIELEAQVDERRSHPQWFLSYKEEDLRPHLNFGPPTAVYQYDLPSGAWVQAFAAGTLMYADAVGHAFELHGLIREAYWTQPNRAELGHPISDEMDTARRGGRKNLFSRGGLYWSPATGARAVTAQLWVDYESMGESAALGLPLAAAESIPGGLRQRFQGGNMYHRTGQPRAFQVHGAILTRFLSVGEVSAWGYPVGNESNLLDGAQVIGRTSEFEGVTCYWSAGTGAFEVHGDIRATYRGLGGPSGKLGLPTSDEGDVPGAGGARFNTFQHGSIVWFGSMGETYVCQAFDINIGRIDSKESEGWGRGQNDVYLHLGVEDNGHVIHAERVPGSGDSNGHNVYGIHRTLNLGPAGIVPNRVDCVIKLTLDIWDSDWPEDDDHLGYYAHELDMANAWGLRGNRGGLFDSGGFDNINSITWSVSPRVNEALLTDDQRWWGVRNRKTDELSWLQYAAAFTDVDSDTEWWDPTDWLAALFYEAAVKGLAKSGNCFGMSLEAIDSYKHRSILRLPLDRFSDANNQWEALRAEFNIKHQYQVGAPAIWWFVGQFLSGNTHDPVDVFHATRDAHAHGMDPVLCIAQNYDFSGAPHCILPVAWDDSSKPWKLWVHDPNYPAPQSPALRAVLVDPDAKTFSYAGSSSYAGGAWSGGRLHYMPYSVLCEQPRTPIFEALMLLLNGAMLIVGSDGETLSLTDENGVDLDAFGADAVARLKAGQSVANKFVSVKGFDAHTDRCAVERTGDKPVTAVVDKPRRPHGVVPAELYLRSQPRRVSRHTPPDRRSGTDWTRLTLREYLCQWAPARIRRAVEANTAFVAANEGRLMIHLLRAAPAQAAGATLSDSVLSAAMLSNDSNSRVSVAALSALGPVVQSSSNFIHTLRGLRRGELRYAFKQGLTEVMISGESVAGDLHTLKVRDLGTHTNTVRLMSSRDKVMSLLVHSRIGVGRDHVRLRLDGLTVSAGQEMSFNVKPGLGGVDVVSNGQLNVQATLELVRKGVRYSGKFALTSKQGLRVLPSTFLTTQALKVAQIDRLFGDSLKTMLVKSL